MQLEGTRNYTLLVKQLYSEAYNILVLVLNIQWELFLSSNICLLEATNTNMQGLFLKNEFLALIWEPERPGLNCVPSKGAQGLPQGLSGRESACSAVAAREAGQIPGPGRSPGEGNANSLQYSCLGNPVDRGVWRSVLLGITESQTQLGN